MNTLKRRITQITVLSFLLLSSQISFSQKYTPTPGYFKWTGGIFDYGFRMPVRDTVAAAGKTDSLGFMVLKPEDSTVYRKGNPWWYTVGKSAAPSLQAVTTAGDTTKNVISYTGFVNFQNVTGLTIGRGVMYSGNIFAGTREDLQTTAKSMSFNTSALFVQADSGFQIQGGKIGYVQADSLRFITNVPLSAASFNSRVSGELGVQPHDFATISQLSDSAVTASQGLTKVVKDIQLGGSFSSDRIVTGNNTTNMYFRGTSGTDFSSDLNTGEVRIRATGIRSRLIDNTSGLLNSMNQTATGTDIQGTAPWNFFLNNGNQIRVNITADSFRVVHDKIRLQGSVQADRIGIGKVPGRPFEAVNGRSLFAWDGYALQLSDDTLSFNNVSIGYKAGIEMNGIQNTNNGYAAGEFLNGNANSIYGYGSAIAVKGNGNTFSGYRTAFNINSSYSTGIGYQALYDTYGNFISVLGANIIINSNSYRNIDTIHAGDISNTLISGSKIRTIIDALSLRQDSIYIGKMRWLNTAPSSGSPTFYKLKVDSASGTFTSQTYSHGVDTGAGLIVINILPRVSNVSAIGANATIDSSNQVVMGDTTTVQLKTGRQKWDISNQPSDGDSWIYNNTRKRWVAGATGNSYANKQNGQLLKFNHIGGSPVTNPIIPVNPSGWDQGINEIGNVIKVGSTYIMVYSGYATPYVQDAVYAGLATSTDGITWVKKGPANDGKILTTASEDPYIVYNAGTYYLYVERKVLPVTGIELYTSTDLLTWSSQGVVVDQGAGGTWDATDASSPTVLLENGTWTMLYEGRSPTQSGAVGVATSANGLTWTKYGSNPVMGGTGTTSIIPWALNVVPDDIFKVEGKYYMSFHGSHPSVYSGAMAISSDLLTWKDYLGSWLLTDTNNESTGDGIMYYFDGNEYVATYVTPTGGIGRGRLVMKDDFSIGSKAITTTGNLTTGATSITGTLAVSGTLTGAAISGTTGTFSGLVAMSSGYTTNNNALNWFIPSAQGAGSSTNAKFTFGGASNVFFRRAMGGTTTATLTTGVGYAGTVAGGENVTKFTSGTQGVISSFALKPPRILGTGADVPLAASFYSDSATTGAMRNYNFYFGQGDIGIGKGQLRLSTTLHGSSTDSLLIKRSDSTVGGLSATELAFNASQITAGTLPIARGGTGLTALGTASQQIRVNSGATALEYFTPSSSSSTTPLKDVYTDQGNSSSTPNNYSALHTFNVAANTLTANGQKILMTSGGNYSATVGTKDLQLFIGGNGCGTFLSTSVSDGWHMDVFFIRTGTTTGRVIARVTGGTALSDAIETDLTGMDFTNAITFAVWGASGTGTINDVTAKLTRWVFEQAAP